jgi:hypothetical protein
MSRLGAPYCRRLKEVLEAAPKPDFPSIEISPVEEIAKIQEKTPETTSRILLQLWERNRLV